MDGYLARARAIAEELTALRRSLHRCPELGFDLTQTRDLVSAALSAAGCRDIRALGGGLTARLGRAEGRTLLLRADMDALPMAEESGLPFAAGNGAAHACGHDLHTAMLLGAARLLKEREEALEGRVVLMFQAAEETASGARTMVEEGVLDGVDAALALHVATQRPVGWLNCTRGAKTASFDRFALHIEGKGGHGASPQNNIDPINAGVHLYLALQELVSHECPPDETAVLTIGAFQAGAAGNVIPARARLEGTARAHSRETRALLLRRLGELTEGVCAVFGARGTVEWMAQVPPLWNDPDLTGRMAGYARAVLGEGLVSEEPERLTASEDFSLVAERVPTAYLTIGTGRAEDGYLYGNHHPKVVYDEGVLPLGAAVLARCAEDFLREG
ncbi:MAG TPA: amidohydrolase [Candidatus Galloscillospira excrementavium]|nr:amidohydrolase [Candidatus Galloscillospira excrementavium]